jgi:hypothetical protein
MLSMIKKVVIAASLLVLLSFAMFGSARGQTLTAGVAAGESFSYSLTSFWTSSDEYASIPSDLVVINQTESLEARISDVSGSNVTIFTATYFRNGTADAIRGSVELQTGESTGGFVAIIAANLTAGDRIHSLGQDTITINDTVIRSYASGDRETNQIIIEYQNATTGTTGSVDRYFDKQTGILVEEVDETSYTNPDTTTRITTKLKEATAWSVPEFPSVLILPLFATATLLSAIAYKKKRASITKTLASAKTP